MEILENQNKNSKHSEISSIYHNNCDATKRSGAKVQKVDKDGNKMNK